MVAAWAGTSAMHIATTDINANGIAFILSLLFYIPGALARAGIDIGRGYPLISLMNVLKTLTISSSDAVVRTSAVHFAAT